MADAKTLELDDKLSAAGLKTGERYVLRRKAATDVKLRVRLCDGLYQPCGGVAVKLETENGLSFKGTADGDGWFEQSVPAGTKKVRVVYKPKDDDEIELDLAVSPPDRKDDEAYLGHLRNLGFGTDKDEAELVIMRFQGTHDDLYATGELDDATKKAIDEVLEGKRLKVTGS